MRFIAILSLPVLAGSCGRAIGQQQLSPNQEASNGSNESSSAVDNLMAVASEVERDAPKSFDELKLVRSDDVAYPRSPAALPAPYAAAEFGFFDDGAILRQLPKRQLITMEQSDYGFRFVADLDHDGSLETYRTGWIRMPGQEARQMLAVFEAHDQRVRDVWVTDDNADLLAISRHNGFPIVFSCNCPRSAPIIYKNKKLAMKMHDF